MEQTTEKYEESKVESLKRFLESKVGKKNKDGESLARYYEIFVDNLKVVERTNDPEEFDNYTDFLRDGTKEIRVLIYTYSATAPKLTSKHIFKMLPDEPQKEPGLSGAEISAKITEAVSAERQKWEFEQLKKELEATKKDSSLSGVEVQSRITESISSERQKWEFEQVKRELEETKKDLEEAEEYIDTLETQTEELKRKKGLDDVKSAERIGLVVETIARRNVGLLGKIPFAKGLAGVIAEDNERKANENDSPAEQPSEASFSEKKEEDDSMTPQMKARLQFAKSMERAFKVEEYNTIMKIIQAFSLKKESIQDVADLLNIKN
jgi:hypothetical protein